MLRLYNTLTRKKEIFKAINKNSVGLYTCGPTVYNYAHIGNLRTYIFEDILKRVLFYNNYKIKHVMNITDVGHLTSDADTGEDKLEKGAKREGKTAWEIAEFYTRAFKDDLKKLNIIPPEIWCKATDNIKEQINLIKRLEKKEFTYKTEDGIYFDTSKLKDYGKLFGLKKEKLKSGIRIEIKDKKNITDFALWKFSPKDKKRDMEWKSDFGTGFPGWHIECSAMSMKHLGETFDIHCGGIDHIQVHHTNEIAQSEGATGKKFVNYWLHGEFLILKNEKMAKSGDNFITLNTLIKNGYGPLEYRYLCLTAHYKSPLEFNYENLDSAKNGLNRLKSKILEFKDKKGRLNNHKIYEKKFLEFINDDLNTPKALALLWGLIDDKNLTNQDKYILALKFDKIFGLDLGKENKEKIPKEIIKLAEEREKARKEKNWQKSDKLREEIKNMGYLVEDIDFGYILKKN
jgi:cysteinyl-tRNA synthetase